MKDKQSEEKGNTFLLRIEPELKEFAKKAAKIDNRSLNGHIINLVKEDLKEKKLS